MCFRHFRIRRTRFEQSQERTDREGGLNVWSFIMCDGRGPGIIFDGCINSLKYIDLIEEH